jgi:hypothetical protein
MKMIEIDPAPISDLLLRFIRSEYERHYSEKYQGEMKGLYREADWRRLEYATSLIPADTESVLEVGVGPGPLLNYLTMCRRYKKVVGIDIRRYSRFLPLSPNLDLRLMRVEKMDFETASFDMVFCMEVLEHVPVEVMLRGIYELRRVAGKRLVMSVPFEEPLPLPSYHLQRFERERLLDLFPDAEIRLVHRPRRKGLPWALMIEIPGVAHSA